MALKTVSEIRSPEAAKLELREATRELLYALGEMTKLLGRCLESPVEPTPELEAEYEKLAVHVLDVAFCVRDIAATLKVA